MKKELKDSIKFILLIGDQIKILDSKNKNDIGISGTIIFESEDFFHIKVKDEVKKIVKKNIKFEVIKQNTRLEVQGEILSKNIIKRLKKLK